MVRARMWTANKRMPLGVPRVGEVLKGGRMKNKTEKENPQHKRSRHARIDVKIPFDFIEVKEID